MDVYTLNADEIVILKNKNVMEGNSDITLILTSQCIIQVNRNFWGIDKSSIKIPLLDLKEHNGKPNILISKDLNDRTELQLYFHQFMKSYYFQGLLEERKWASAIEKAYKDCVLGKKRSEKSGLKVSELISPFKDTINMAKGAAIFKKFESKPKTIKCPKCGNELTGEKGEDVKCIFCDTVVTIK